MDTSIPRLGRTSRGRPLCPLQTQTCDVVPRQRGCPGHAGEGRQHRVCPILHRQEGWCMAGGGHERSCQPRPHAKRLPLRTLRLHSHQTKGAGHEAAGTAGFPAPGMAGKRAPSQPAASYTLAPLSAAPVTRGTHTLCFNDRDSLFKNNRLCRGQLRKRRAAADTGQAR